MQSSTISFDKRHLLYWLPHIVVAAWISFVGYTLWQHVEKTEQPPIYDAATYFQKAQNFWVIAHEARAFNPLNVEPTTRPPGTVLMSYPFGFDTDFRGFYFRSVFLPIVCLTLAVYVIGYSRTLWYSEQWNLAIIAIFLTTLPMFYHLEWTGDSPSPVYWGLVDNFLAGIAALAAAACVRSVTNRSMGWLIAAAFAASLCILIKPAGGFVMVLMGLSWLFGVLLRLTSRNEPPVAQKLLRRFLIRGTAVMMTVFGLVFIWCFSSRYFSFQNMSFGTRAMQLLGTEWSPPITLDLLYGLIRVSFGYVLPLTLIITALLAIAYWARFEPAIPGLSRTAFAGMILATCLYLVVGIWFWIAATGVTQVRYFFPFALMAVICMIPLLMEVMKRMPRWGRVTARTLWILPAVNLGLLIGQAHPSAEWERWAGTKLTSGTSIEEIRMAETLLNDVKKSGTNAYLYAFFPGTAHAIVFSVSLYANLLHPSQPTIRIQLPVDWRRPSVHRLSEIEESDYILFEPLHDRSVQTNAFSQKSIQSLSQEALLFNAWFTDLTVQDGVTVVAETPAARLLKVSDSKRLDASLRELKKRHSWRPVFDDANPRRWWSGRDVAEFLKNYPPQMSDIHFGDEVRLHALSLERGENEITVRLWWNQLHVDLTDDWYFFFHLLDGSGSIIDNTQISLHSHGPLSPDQPLRFDVVAFEGAFRRVNRLALGIHQPANGLSLVADKGLRDWDNHRVIIPLPAESVRNPMVNDAAGGSAELLHGSPATANSSTVQGPSSR